METLLRDVAWPGMIEYAAELLAAGELVALPTETVYGLAADAANPAALAAIFQVKERPLFDPLIVHLSDLDWLPRLTLPPNEVAGEVVARLTASFWPGPLTLVLPRRPDAVPDLITAGGELVAVRMSAQPAFNLVLRALGRPVAAPSANRFGRISPTTGAHVLAELGGRIPLILDAGPTGWGVESTVVHPRADGVIQILRHGPITEETLGRFGPVEAPPARDAARKAAPGQTVGHYAPRTPLVFADGEIPPAPRIGRLIYRRDEDDETFAATEYLSAAGDLREAAANLFAALRRLDDANLDLIVADRVPEEGIGRAINERLDRAVTGSGESQS